MNNSVDLSKCPPSVRLVLLVNAIYFDEPYLVKLIVRFYKTVEELPDQKETIDLLKSDKQISQDEAESRYVNFIYKYYININREELLA